MKDIMSFAQSDQYHRETQDLINIYFYHYCKGSGHPITLQQDAYVAPIWKMLCEDDQCKPTKEVSHSACYDLGESFNFPVDDENRGVHEMDRELDTWSRQNRASVKLVQFGTQMPWFWRNSLRNGWFTEWNAYAYRHGDIYGDYDKIFVRNIQRPVAYTFVGIAFYLSTAISIEPLLWTLRVKSYAMPLLNILSPTATGFCISWSTFSLLLPVYNAIYGQSIPGILPPDHGWVLSSIWVTSTTLLMILGMVFILYCFATITNDLLLGRTRYGEWPFESIIARYRRVNPAQLPIKTMCGTFFAIHTLSVWSVYWLLYVLRWAPVENKIKIVGVTTFCMIAYLVWYSLHIYSVFFLFGCGNSVKERRKKGYRGDDLV